ncbi:hypothetical protein [Thalassospira profundimaris]|uniref:hypothetical protein n=1 Tax=Thalassospira profundimaris TaxID=502049 RepID=UPI0012F6F2C6|nr:hypothetical protein [Thalassospira profundimaris]
MSEAEVLEAVRGDTATEADIRLTTKFAHWSYEAEERVFCQLDDPKIIQDKGMYFLPFDYGFNLREVILGPKYQPVTDATLKEKLEAAVAEMVPCTVRSTRPAFRSFNVVFQQNKKLSKEI